MYPVFTKGSVLEKWVPAFVNINAFVKWLDQRQRSTDKWLMGRHFTMPSNMVWYNFIQHHKRYPCPRNMSIIGIECKSKLTNKWLKMQRQFARTRRKNPKKWRLIAKSCRHKNVLILMLRKSPLLVPLVNSGIY